MDRVLERFGDSRRALAGRAVASASAALARAAAAESTALLATRLLVDGAAATVAWSAARLALWLARALGRAVRAAVAA